MATQLIEKYYRLCISTFEQVVADYYHNILPNYKTGFRKKHEKQLLNNYRELLSNMKQLSVEFAYLLLTYYRQLENDMWKYFDHFFDFYDKYEEFSFEVLQSNPYFQEWNTEEEHDCGFDDYVNGQVISLKMESLYQKCCLKYEGNSTFDEDVSSDSESELDSSSVSDSDSDSDFDFDSGSETSTEDIDYEPEIHAEQYYRKYCV